MFNIQIRYKPGDWSQGTLSGNYKADSNYIFAKTASLSGVVALSGYLYTKKINC